MMQNSGVAPRGRCRVFFHCHAPRMRGIQYPRDVEAHALAPLEYWIARSSRAMTPSLLFDS